MFLDTVQCFALNFAPKCLITYYEGCKLSANTMRSFFRQFGAHCTFMGKVMILQSTAYMRCTYLCPNFAQILPEEMERFTVGICRWYGCAGTWERVLITNTDRMHPTGHVV
jgi:hypothetical protein